eukprot:Hpha_TRINITY_DN15415_c1_g4::TRINITY_DN15415_c1_g4_i4::g.175491::m.175491
MGPPTVIPREYWLYSESPLRHAFRGDTQAEYDQDKGMWRKCIFPSAKPTGRIEVFLLARTLDRMMSAVDHSALEDADGCYSADSNTFNTTFKALFEVYNTGFGELIRQVYIQCAERGVILDRIRSLYSDFAENCFDIVDYLKLQLRRRIAAAKRAEELMATARTELKTAKHQEGLLRSDLAALKAKNEELESRLKDQSALEYRDTLMRKFLDNQAERNAMLLHVQSYQATTPAQSKESESQGGDEDGEEEGGEDGERRKRRRSTKMGGEVQVDPWDEPLYMKLVTFCDQLRKTVSSCEGVTAEYFGRMVYRNPLENASWARDKLQRIVQTHVMPVVSNATGAGPTPEEMFDKMQTGISPVKPLEGSFSVTKQMLSELFAEVNSTLREVVTRLNTYSSSPQAIAKIQAADANPTPVKKTVEDAATPNLEALQFCVDFARAVATRNYTRADELAREAPKKGAHAGDVLGASYRAVLTHIRELKEEVERLQVVAAGAGGRGTPALSASPASLKGTVAQYQKSPPQAYKSASGGEDSPDGNQGVEGGEDRKALQKQVAELMQGVQSREEAIRNIKNAEAQQKARFEGALSDAERSRRAALTRAAHFESEAKRVVDVATKGGVEVALGAFVPEDGEESQEYREHSPGEESQEYREHSPGEESQEY